MLVRPLQCLTRCYKRGLNIVELAFKVSIVKLTIPRGLQLRSPGPFSEVREAKGSDRICFEVFLGWLGGGLASLFGFLVFGVWGSVPGTLKAVKKLRRLLRFWIPIEGSRPRHE